MSRHQIRGACPGLQVPMLTGDGLLVRIAPRGGELSLVQLAAIGQAAELFGNGVIEFSSRGNLQIRGVSEESHEGLLQAIKEAGIALEGRVPVLAPMLFAADKGRPKSEPSFAERLRQRLDEAGFLDDLAPKTAIIVDEGGLLDLSLHKADIRVLRLAGQGWQIWVGGTMQEARCVGVAGSDEEALAAIMQLLQLLAQKGRKMRGRDLSDSDLAAITLPQEVFPIPQGEKEPDRLVGVMEAGEGSYTLGLAFPFGSTSAAQLMKLAGTAEKAGAERVALLPGKRLAILGLEQQAAQDLQKRAVGFGMVTRPDDLRLQFLTCAGAPACSAGLLHTKKVAEDLIETFAGDLVGDVCVHVSGCPKRCAADGRIDMEIVGTQAGVEMASLAQDDKHGEQVERILQGIAERLAQG